MSDGVQRMDFDKPETVAERRAREAALKGEEPKRPKRPRPVIPVLPTVERISAEQMKKPDQRAIATVNMKLAGAPWVEIVNELAYASVESAQQAYYNALAGMYPMSNWETLRQEATLRAEQAYMHSLAMARATHFVDQNDPETLIPNTDQRQWHEQNMKDLALWVSITGAKAPARIEVSADAQELNSMVQALLAASGQMPEAEPDVFEIQELPPAPQEESW